MGFHREQNKYESINIIICHFFNATLGSSILMVYTYFGNTLTVANTFTILMYIGRIQGPLGGVPHMMEGYNRFKTSMKKLEHFMNLEEVPQECLVEKLPQESEYAISIDNHSFSWGVKKQEEEEKEEEKKEEKKEAETKKENKEDSQDERLSTTDSADEKDKTEKKEKKEETNQKLGDIVTLKNIDFKVKKGEFVCIIGEVKSGKSSILSSVIGDMLHVSPGRIEKFGGFENLMTEQSVLEEFQDDIVKQSQLMAYNPPVKVGGSTALVQ